MKIIHTYLLTIILLALSSCGLPQMCVSSATYFPPGSDDDSGSHKIICTACAEGGKQFGTLGNKEVALEFHHKRQVIDRKVFAMQAGDLDWKVNWTNLSFVRIEFFERSRPTNMIRTIAITIDPQTDRVSEVKLKEM